MIKCHVNIRHLFPFHQSDFMADQPGEEVLSFECYSKVHYTNHPKLSTATRELAAGIQRSYIKCKPPVRTHLDFSFKRISFVALQYVPFPKSNHTSFPSGSLTFSHHGKLAATSYLTTFTLSTPFSIQQAFLYHQLPQNSEF